MWGTLPLTKENFKSLKYSPCLWLQVLPGNTDNVHTEGRILDPPIIARFIKINVKTYRGRPSLRVELYGCSDGMDNKLFCLSLEIFSPVDIKVVIKTITKGYLFDKTYTKLFFTSKFIIISVADLPLAERIFFTAVHQLSELSNLKMKTEIRISQLICHFQRENINKLIILLIPDTLKLS